jgi:3-phosphoshikimate 1-carboxyvinyltransferase
VDSHGDHRLAMSLAIAGLVAKGETTILGAEAIAVSFPGFEQTLEGIVS